jgi:hypothetical protein
MTDCNDPEVQAILYPKKLSLEQLNEKLGLLKSGLGVYVLRESRPNLHFTMGYRYTSNGKVIAELDDDGDIHVPDDVTLDELKNALSHFMHSANKDRQIKDVERKIEFYDW